MSDLHNRLQRALGDQYRLGDELGGGGMSRVFVADEVRLGRKVVIKLLPPDASATIDAGRFEREIQMAASLHHPHIVQLLAAGEGDGLLWYVMPYVDGESLAQRIARDGALSVLESVRILREVGDALAAAHDRGIVHRDIKPANILLSGRHALVADFGVAKALSDSADRQGTLTSVGMALGTPAYMAPEQALADPNVDHRADIYALGVVAYEMLTGRLPFDATTPQALLAAHVTQAPAPIAGRRADLSADLAAIVMKCLEKSPRDRWKSASDLVDALERVGTPSGGSAAFDVSQLQRRARAWHPGRVIALHAVASIALVALSYWSTRVLGLPDWVWYATAVAMLLGVPALLVAARNERDLANATLAGIPAPRSRFSLSGRRALQGGLAAIASVIVAGGAFATSRVLGIGPGATLLTAGQLGAADRLVLADFTNTTSDSTLTGSIVEALRVDLGQSSAIRLVPPADVTTALQMMGRETNERVERTLAVEVAQRINANAVVAGDVRPLGTGFVLSADIIDAGTARVLASVRATAADASGLIAAVNELSTALRERIGESLKAVRASVPLDQVTTSSLPALRLYSAGTHAFLAGEYTRARDLLEEAVKVDTAFAMAWRKLSATYSNLGNDPTRLRIAAERAFAHSDRLTPVERHLAEGSYFVRVRNDPDAAIRSYLAALAIDSLEPIALNNAGMSLNAVGRYSEAEVVLRRATTHFHVYSNYDNFADALILQRKWAAADSLRAQWINRGGDSTRAMVLAVFPAVARRDVARIRLLVDSLVRRVPAGMTTHRTAVYSELAALAYAGKLDSALHKELASEAVISGARREAREVEVRIQHAAARAALGADVEGAWRAARELERAPAYAAIPDQDRPYIQLAEIAAQNGLPAEVRRYRALADRATPVDQRSAWYATDWNLVDAIANRRWNDVVTDGKAIAEITKCQVCGAYEAARAHHRLGQRDSAIAVFERAIDAPTIVGWSGVDVRYFPTALFRLGELHQAKGNRTKALDYFTKFTALWKDADADLQPMVKEAKRFIAELTAER